MSKHQQQLETEQQTEIHGISVACAEESERTQRLAMYDDRGVHPAFVRLVRTHDGLAHVVNGEAGGVYSTDDGEIKPQDVWQHLTAYDAGQLLVRAVDEADGREQHLVGYHHVLVDRGQPGWSIAGVICPVCGMLIDALQNVPGDDSILACFGPDHDRHEMVLMHIDALMECPWVGE